MWLCYGGPLNPVVRPGGPLNEGVGDNLPRFISPIESGSRSLKMLSKTEHYNWL